MDPKVQFLGFQRVHLHGVSGILNRYLSSYGRAAAFSFSSCCSTLEKKQNQTPKQIPAEIISALL